VDGGAFELVVADVDEAHGGLRDHRKAGLFDQCLYQQLHTE
jgi:hypothetical protein